MQTTSPFYATYIKKKKIYFEKKYFESPFRWKQYLHLKLAWVNKHIETEEHIQRVREREIEIEDYIHGERERRIDKEREALCGCP